MMSSPSAYAESVDQVMLYIVGISVLLLVGITVAMIYFVIKYNRKKHPKAAQIEGNVALEVVWIVIPFILVMSMFWYGYTDFQKLRKASDAALIVKVKGQMWKWDFEYPNGKKSDTLFIPVNKMTRLEMTSVDVNHSFYVPSFRLKEDVINGKTTYLILEPRTMGTFDIACAEYCGLNHAYMYAKLHVVGNSEFDNWLEPPRNQDSTVSELQKSISDSASIKKL